jgi:hypothetical protein
LAFMQVADERLSRLKTDLGWLVSFRTHEQSWAYMLYVWNVRVWVWPIKSVNITFQAYHLLYHLSRKCEALQKFNQAPQLIIQPGLLSV